MSQSKPWILMCPPDHYGIEYEINPWMSRSRGADHKQATRQWRTLHDKLVQLGVQVSLVDPQQDLPDMVFTANAGVVYRNEFFGSRFRHKVRAGESPHFEHWFRSVGFEVRELPEETYFEGAGDALFCGNTLFGGYRIRSDIRSHQHVANQIRHQVLPLELVDPRFYHLDTCFCPVLADVVIWYPGAFDTYAQQVVKQNIPDVIDVSKEEALKFACNVVVVGRTIIVPTGCTALRRELESRDFEVCELELNEYLKAGGSAKCLTLRIDGEEAAVWEPHR